MKKILSVIALVGLTVVPAFAAPSYLVRDSQGGYNITYNYQDKAKNGWYIGGRAELSLLNWKNKYSTDSNYIPLGEAASDNYSAEPVLGGNFFAGYTINYLWRAELEAGYIGYFEDKDSDVDFSLLSYYLMANGYYDFSNGLYVGAGVGMALTTTTLDGVTGWFDGDKRDKTRVSPMLGLMLGYTHELNDSLVLDLRYRLSGFYGTKHSVDFVAGVAANHWFENNIDLILDNSFSVGLRYEF